jgi:GDP-L-fucose synthase
MNILVTGASGFLGRHLIPFLESKGHTTKSITSKEFDLTDCRSLYKIEETNFDCIYHLAAWTQAGDFCYLHGGEQWIINQQINTNVLAWWKDKCPQAKMVAMGTSASYATENDLVETKYLDGLPIDKFYAYAMTKRMLLAGLQSLHKQFGMNYLHVIPSTLYGPGYHLDGRQMHFIFDLIKKILLGKLHNQPVVLWGDGYQLRELVFVDDFVKNLYNLNEKCSNEIYNIGSGEDYSIRQFADMICEIVDYDASKISYDSNQYVGAKSKILNIQKLKAEIDISATPIKEGIEKTIAWMKENLN